ncbi:MAG: RES domain-containing protein [Desulfobacteraceae bacterium]|nr:RES domain-containing protein [Desulfobacteraceae bacterium]
MITAYRIVKEKYVSSLFKGEGARLYGGRWNEPGIAMIYTADSLALSALETYVNVVPETPLNNYKYVSVSFDEKIVKTFEKIPKGWDTHPIQSVSRHIGNNWAYLLESVVLKVPSAVIPIEFNYLINPDHPDFDQCLISIPQAFNFDPRLK